MLSFQEIGSLLRSSEVPKLRRSLQNLVSITYIGEFIVGRQPRAVSKIERLIVIMGLYIRDHVTSFDMIIKITKA